LFYLTTLNKKWGWLGGWLVGLLLGYCRRRLQSCHGATIVSRQSYYAPFAGRGHRQPDLQKEFLLLNYIKLFCLCKLMPAEIEKVNDDKSVVSSVGEGKQVTDDDDDDDDWLVVVIGVMTAAAAAAAAAEKLMRSRRFTQILTLQLNSREAAKLRNQTNHLRGVGRKWARKSLLIQCFFLLVSSFPFSLSLSLFLSSSSSSSLSLSPP
jgi:hypothetical protein